MRQWFSTLRSGEVALLLALVLVAALLSEDTIRAATAGFLEQNLDAPLRSVDISAFASTAIDGINACDWDLSSASTQHISCLEAHYSVIALGLQCRPSLSGLDVYQGDCVSVNAAIGLVCTTTGLLTYRGFCTSPRTQRVPTPPPAVSHPAGLLSYVVDAPAVYAYTLNRVFGLDAGVGAVIGSLLIAVALIVAAKLRITNIWAAVFFVLLILAIPLILSICASIVQFLLEIVITAVEHSLLALVVLGLGFVFLRQEVINQKLQSEKEHGGGDTSGAGPTKG